MDIAEKHLLTEICIFNDQQKKPYEICSGKPGKLKEELNRLKIAKTMAARGLIELQALNMQEVFANITTHGKILVATF